MIESNENTAQSTPMNPWPYIALFLPGTFAANIFLRMIGGPIDLAIILPTLAIALFVFAAWNNLDPGTGRTNPRLAALLLFVPIVNLAWIYWAIYPIGKTVKSDAIKYGLMDEVGDAFSRTCCHLLIATIALFILFVLEITRMPYSSIPYLPLLPIEITLFVVLILWLVIVHIMIFHYSRIINSIAAKKQERRIAAEQSVPGYPPQGVGSPEP